MQVVVNTCSILTVQCSLQQFFVGTALGKTSLWPGHNLSYELCCNIIKEVNWLHNVTTDDCYHIIIACKGSCFIWGVLVYQKYMLLFVVTVYNLRAHEELVALESFSSLRGGGVF